jgi:hypothetical protein
MGLGPDPAVVRAWVEQSCAGQGVAVKISDPLTVRRVGVLLGASDVGGPGADGGRTASGARAARAARVPRRRRVLQPPDGVDAGGVEAAGP